VINTIAGNGGSGFIGDNGPALNAQFNLLGGLSSNPGNPHIAAMIPCPCGHPFDSTRRDAAKLSQVVQVAQLYRRSPRHSVQQPDRVGIEIHKIGVSLAHLLR